MSLQRHSIFDTRPSSLLSLAATATLALTASACTTAGDSPEDTADLVLRGGRVVTVDEALPEAQAVAIRGDRILFVGSDSEVEAYTGRETEVIDLAGRLAIPGFIEGHGHLMGLGQSRLQLDLMATASYQDLIDLVAEAVAGAQPGEWIVGRGWHQSKWDPAPDPAVRGFQTHHALSEVSPDNPVLLGTPPGTPASPTRWPWSWRG